MSYSTSLKLRSKKTFCIYPSKAGLLTIEVTQTQEGSYYDSDEDRRFEDAAVLDSLFNIPSSSSHFSLLLLLLLLLFFNLLLPFIIIIITWARFQHSLVLWVSHGVCGTPPQPSSSYNSAGAASSLVLAAARVCHRWRLHWENYG